MLTVNIIIQKEIAEAFENGLRLRYGEALGALYGEVLRYRAGNFLETDELRADLDTEAVPVLRAILTNKVESSTLHGIRSLMIGCAIAEIGEGYVGRPAIVVGERQSSTEADLRAHNAEAAVEVGAGLEHMHRAALTL